MCGAPDERNTTMLRLTWAPDRGGGTQLANSLKANVISRRQREIDRPQSTAPLLFI
jgi:hypothetical protein